MEKSFDKKLETKRLIIYLLFSFGLAWIIFLVPVLKGFKWDGSKPDMESFVGLGMLAPLAANVIARMITKEGFAMTGENSMMLGISFKSKKWMYYLFALFIPWLYTEISNALTIIVFPEAYDANLYKAFGIDKGLTYFYPVIIIISAVICSFAALGEEGGWRAYMMPKLIKLMGKKKAFILGGVIWGLWHAPLTCIGHNFGTDYPGFPYLGIAVMCVFCIIMGIILTFVTAQTGSVWPAAFLHAVNNSQPSALYFFTNQQVLNDSMPNPLIGWVFLLIHTAIIAIICLIVMLKRDCICEK